MTGLINQPRNDLGRAIYALMCSPQYIAKYPDGATAHEIIGEIRGFPLCTWLDVYDELVFMYGRPK